jgi:hypothetical protein
MRRLAMAFITGFAAVLLTGCGMAGVYIELSCTTSTFDGVTWKVKVNNYDAQSVTVTTSDLGESGQTRQETVKGDGELLLNIPVPKGKMTRVTIVGSNEGRYDYDDVLLDHCGKEGLSRM